MHTYDDILDYLSDINAITEATQTSNKSLIPILKKSDNKGPQQLGYKPLNQCSDVKLNELIELIKSHIPSDLQKYIKYFIIQYAKGNIKYSGIPQTCMVISDMIMTFNRAIKSPKWTYDRDLYKYDNWESLDHILRESGVYDSAPKQEIEHSRIVYTQTYTDQYKLYNARLFNEPEPEPVTFWLRKILTQIGATRYGKGTTWCTTTAGGTQDPAQSYAMAIINRNGLYLVEKKTPSKPRRPILQISEGQCSGPSQEGSIVTFKRLLSRFLLDAIKHDTKHEISDAVRYEILDRIPNKFGG